MKLAVVGVGNAGSRVTNRILDLEKSSGRNLCNGNTLLINSEKPAFDATEHVPDDRRLVIGDVHRGLDGQGIDGDPDLAAEVAREEQHEINRAFDLIEFHQVDGVVVVAGLAGGTGGGAGAVVIDQLQSICDEPVYACGVLPGEFEGQEAALTAARALQSFVENADNVIAFDNDAWHAQDTSESESNATDGEYARTNAALARRIVTLFAAGEFEGSMAPENRMDPSDIIRTLEIGGISSIGYASTDVPPTRGIRPWIRRLRRRLPGTPEPDEDKDEPTDAAKINELVRRAARSKLTLPCEVSSADRALIVLSGPSRALSRKGFESGRYWLEGEADIVEVLAGDEPHDRTSTLTATVLFSNVTDVSRIEAMQEQAIRGPQTSSTTDTRFETVNPG